MAHFAQLDENNRVTKVVVVLDGMELQAIEALTQRYGGTWLQTSYNARIRGKFAGLGDLYDPVTDTFQTPPE